MSSDAISGSCKPLRSASAAWQNIDGEMVILRVKEKELLGLNEVGRRIWELADGTRSIDEMVEVVAAEYGVPVNTVRTDILPFVQELASICTLDLPN